MPLINEIYEANLPDEIILKAQEEIIPKKNKPVKKVLKNSLAFLKKAPIKGEKLKKPVKAPIKGEKLKKPVIVQSQNRTRVILERKVQNKALIHIKHLGSGVYGSVNQVHLPRKGNLAKKRGLMDDLRVDCKMARALQNHPCFVKLRGGLIKKPGANREGFLFMEYINGPTLWNYPLQSIEQLKNFTIDILDAFAFALQNNVIPKDVHLNNMMVQNGKIRIIDLGLYEKAKQGFGHRDIEDFLKSLKHALYCLEYKAQVYQEKNPYLRQEDKNIAWCFNNLAGNIDRNYWINNKQNILEDINNLKEKLTRA